MDRQNRQGGQQRTTLLQAITYWKQSLDSPVMAYIPVVECGLTPEDLEATRERQQRLRQEFDWCVTASHETLKRLEAEGADMVSVLYLLWRYGQLRSTEPPRPRSLTFRSGDFHPPAPVTGEVTLDDADALARTGRLTARKTFRAAPIPRRRRGAVQARALTPGPAETPVSFGMALLARELRRTTRRAHYREIAQLFRVWAPEIRGASYLTEQHVRARVSRVKREQGPELARLSAWFDGFQKALAYDF